MLHLEATCEAQVSDENDKQQHFLVTVVSIQIGPRGCVITL